MTSIGMSDNNNDVDDNAWGEDVGQDVNEEEEEDDKNDEDVSEDVDDVGQVECCGCGRVIFLNILVCREKKPL